MPYQRALAHQLHFKSGTPAQRVSTTQRNPKRVILTILISTYYFIYMQFAGFLLALSKGTAVLSVHPGTARSMHTVLWSRYGNQGGSRLMWNFTDYGSKLMLRHAHPKYNHSGVHNSCMCDVNALRWSTTVSLQRTFLCGRTSLSGYALYLVQRFSILKVLFKNNSKYVKSLTRLSVHVKNNNNNKTFDTGGT